MECSSKIRRLAIKEEMRKAADVAEEAANSQAFAAVARAGYAVSGLLHVLIGVIALQLAFGSGGEADVSGAVTSLASQPYGPLLLWACFAACAALALWQLGNAILGHRNASDKITKRLSAIGQAIVFAALATTIISFVAGKGQNSRESSSDFTVTLLKAPFGVFLLVAVGAGIAITGDRFRCAGFSPEIHQGPYVVLQQLGAEVPTRGRRGGVHRQGDRPFPGGPAGGHRIGAGPARAVNRA